MTHWGVPEWNLVLNVVVTVLVISYGIWLRNIAQQKDAAKDATIESLRTTIESKDHHIEKLESEALPSVTSAYKNVKEYADSVTKANLELTAKVNTIQAGKASTEKSLQVQGIQIATGIISKRLQEMPQTYLSETKKVYFANDMLGLVNSIITDLGKATNELLGSNPFSKLGQKLASPDVPLIMITGNAGQKDPEKQ